MGANEERAEQRATADRQELVERLSRAIREDGKIEPIKGLHLHRGSSPTEPVHGVTELSFCVIAQGSKEIYVGDECYRYDPAHYLLATVELPVVARLVDASPERPYLSVRIVLDPALVGSVMVEAGEAALQNSADTRAINVSPLDAGLLDATLRLVRLIENPTEARVLAPLITREIVFRFLMGEQGPRLRHMLVLGGYTNRIARAVERIRSNFDKPLRIDHLARELGMSTSGFYQQFKTVTALTPLQFQKQLRLQEARRLMLGEDMDAASAGYRVGYDDAAHFSREYKRLFGMPPMRDVGRVREAAMTS
jgi:AraC-like DNA-binding protein